LRRAALVLVLAACGQAFPPISQIDKLRLLGVRAEPAQLRPGDTTTLTTLVADPKGGGRAVTIAWARCDPPGQLANLLACEDARNVTPLGVGPTIAVRAPDDWLATAPGGPADERFLFVFLVVAAGDEQVVAFKKISVTSKAEPLNRNPVLRGAGASKDGGTVTSVRHSFVVRLVADVDPASHEKYLEDGVEQTEEMMVSWFATAGSMDLSRTFDVYENAWQTPADPQRVQLWVVVRDQRDGTDWTSFDLDVQ